MKRYIKSSTNQFPTTNEDWAQYLKNQLRLSKYDADMLLHDLNNLRADEWLDELKRSKKISQDVVDAFVEFFDIWDDDEDDEDWED